MWFLLISGILGLGLGLLLIFLPYLLKVISRATDWTVISIEDSTLPARLMTGLAQILIGLWLLQASRTYTELWALSYIGIMALVFGVLLIFFHKFLIKLNDWGNTVLFSEAEVGVWQRIIYGIIILLMGFYILYIYFATPR
jgi:hypothetical protein